ncbi:MAG: hypothetical protein AAB867_02085 [Patescibacteria group bacterium]
MSTLRRGRKNKAYFTSTASRWAGFIDRLDFSEMVSGVLTTSNGEECGFRDIIFCYPDRRAVKIQVYRAVGRLTWRPHSAWPDIRKQRTYRLNWAPRSPETPEFPGHWA